ncbi:hypothetical protein G9A89_016312 [Geosiphon pyriformis]|nr:hypothetical protein G9A89_016312 [Geosiphon pyriformis]
MGHSTEIVGQVTATEQESTSEKKQNAKTAASIGAPAAIARSIVLQGLALWYRTPIKLFRPLRVDYLVMARAILPVENQKRHWFRSTSLGMLSHAVELHGVLYTVYISSLERCHNPTSLLSHHPSFTPPPFSLVFLSGSIAGAAQSLIATPMDSLKVRFEVNDLLEGKHRSMFGYAMNTWKELGISSIYRGFGLTLVKDSFSCGLFFGVFEYVKHQCYRSFINEIYNYQSKEVTSSQSDLSSLLTNKPHFMLEPAFVLAAGGLAAISYHLIDYPLDRVRNVFLIEEAQAEYQHEKGSRLYKATWDHCRLMASRTSWAHFLYSDFGATVLRAVPATSIGFLVFELMKRNLDRKYYGNQEGDENKGRFSSWWPSDRLPG